MQIVRRSQDNRPFEHSLVRPGIFPPVWLAPVLIVLACAAAGFVAFGGDPRWMHQPHGLQVILLSRRLLWPSAAVAILLCAALIGLVIANRRSAWWLIGLLPVVALLGRHFAENPSLFVLDNPLFVAADDSRLGVRDDEWVVGLTLNDHAYALPYRMLATTPVVFVSDHEKRVLLLFCAVGNRAIATSIAHELKGRDIEIVSAPQSVPLLYDSRLGQFIVSETGLTVDYKKPVGFERIVQTEKMTLNDWRKQHAETKVLLSYASPASVAAPMSTSTTVAIIAATQPVVLDTSHLPSEPMNFKNGSQCLLLVKDAAVWRAFDRTVGSDLFPKFSAKINHKLPDAALVDSDSNSSWTIDGKAIAGPLKGSKLRELPIETGLDWATLKSWQPMLSISSTAEH